MVLKPVSFARYSDLVGLLLALLILLALGMGPQVTEPLPFGVRASAPATIAHSA